MDSTSIHSTVHSSVHGSSTLLEELAARTAAPRAPVPALCQPGVALRALLFVQGVLGIGAGLVADSVVRWGLAWAAGAAVGVPATLGWLVLACVATPGLARLAPAGRTAAAAALAAVTAGLAWIPMRMLLGALSGTGGVASTGDAGLATLAVALAGAAFGAAIYHWLALRAGATLPAATEARLTELQSRIRPHFLFNTLNTAVALVRVDPARAEEVLEDLSDLFRAALEAGDAPSTLGEEIRLARMYLAIEQMRFGARMSVEWDVEPAVEAARVPPLVLQPLVENAVRHGIESREAPGRIVIKGRVRNGRAWLQVDNSVGGPARPGHGIGVSSTRERLRLMHDLDTAFEAGPYRDGYRVRLAVPLSS